MHQEEFGVKNYRENLLLKSTSELALADFVHTSDIFKNFFFLYMKSNLSFKINIQVKLLSFAITIFAYGRLCLQLREFK